MKSLALTVVLLLGSTAVANAESFTFTGKSANGMQIGGPGPMGKPIVSGTSKGSVDITYASGLKMSSANDCIAWSAPPTSGFTVQGMCSSVDKDGSKSFLLFSCLSLNEKNTASDCWGRITGLSGRLQGKTSTVSWRGTQNADGKGATIAGAGEQN
jgi:hypothetical protein